MVNLNLDFKSLGSILSGPIGWGVLLLIYTCIMIFLGQALNTYDKPTICKSEILLIADQRELIFKLESELSQCISNGETNCIEREQRICRKQKEEIKSNCNLLLNQIDLGCKHD